MAVKDFKVKNGIITGGSVLPDSGESYDLGSSTKKFKDIHLSGTLTGDVTGTVSSIANHTTADLSEGSNLYYTDARVSTLIDSAYITARSGIGIINAGFKDFKYIADSGQTVISGNDASSQTLAFDSNNFQVFINGIRLLGSDFTANHSANTITLTEAAADSDEIIVSTITSGAGTSQPVWSLVSSTPYNAAAGDQLVVDTSSQAITVNLPSGAAFGNQVRIVDGSGTSATNNIIISRSGKKIQGTDSDLTIVVNEAAFGLVYFNTARGWVLIDK